jgi:hypothetical protein
MTGTPAGYADPTAPNGYDAGARPDPGPAPTYGGYAPLDVSYEDYQNSPEFKFRISESQKALDNLSSSMGRVLSGARVKAGVQRAQDVASQGYTDYRNYMTNQYNLDRAFDYGTYRDQVSDYDQNRARSDGLYNDDRNFLTSRYDTRNNQLLSLAGFGTGANAANQSAGQSYAANQGNLALTAANANGNAAISSANAFANGVNNAATGLSYIAGRYMNPAPYSTGYPTMTGLAASDPVYGVI